MFDCLSHEATDRRPGLKRQRGKGSYEYFFGEDVLEAALMEWRRLGLDVIPRHVFDLERRSTVRILSSPFMLLLTPKWLVFAAVAGLFMTFLLDGSRGVLHTGATVIGIAAAGSIVLAISLETSGVVKARRELARLRRGWRSFDREFPLPSLVRARYGSDVGAFQNSRVVQALEKYARSGDDRELSNGYPLVMADIFEPLYKVERKQIAARRAKRLRRTLKSEVISEDN